jgi:hypothetical protein
MIRAGFRSLRGVLPALAGVLFLLAGSIVTWLVATSSYTYPCRLSLELDNYACWGLMGLPLAAGIGSMALGGAVLLRGIFTLPLPRQIGVLRSSKLMFGLGLVLLVGILILTAQLFSGFELGLNLSTLLFATFLGILAFIGTEWVVIYLRPNRELRNNSISPSEQP